MTNFFRKELKLGDKRWHRLVIVAWGLSIIFALFLAYSYIKEERYRADYSDHRVYVWTIEDRLTSKVTDIVDLLKDGEYFDTEMRYSWYTEEDDFLNIPRGNFWCSNKWNVDNLMEVEKLSNARFFSFDNKTFKSIDDYKRHSSEIKWPCVAKTSAIELQYDADWSGSPLYIFTIEHPNKLKVTLWWLVPSVLKSLGVIFLYIIITLALYYKWVIYIIYWPSKKEESD